MDAGAIAAGLFVLFIAVIIIFDFPRRRALVLEDLGGNRAAEEH